MTVDKKKLGSDILEEMSNTQASFQSLGINGDNIAELNPKFNYWPSEVVYSGKHDASIVLGRDRVGAFDKTGGYGALGHTSCASIDIVVGRKSSSENFDIINDYVDPDFITDAARIYISQKADIDDYFTTPSANRVATPARSAIGLKADSLRLVARENLKIVVGTDLKNSQGQVINTTAGVDLIGGGLAELQKADKVVYLKNKREEQIQEIKKGGMQPIPLGVNTAFAFDELATKLQKLCAAVSTGLMLIKNFASATTYHEHTNLVSTYFGQPTYPSNPYIVFSNALQTNLVQFSIKDIDNLRIEIDSFKSDHLKQSGAYYINSRYHQLN